MKKIDMSGDFFCLNINEEYIERCGEIFRTNMDNIIIHCTMCENKYSGFDAFAAHISNEHVNKFIQPIASFDTNQEVCGKSDVILQHDPMDEHLKDMDMFDLTFLENFLVNNDLNDNSNQDIQAFLKTATANEAPLDSEIPTEFREVRKCNIQNSIEERPHKCPICGLGFKDKYNMLHHSKRHSTERKHECSDCNKKFYTGYELRIHTKIHTGELPFLCQDCGRSFRTNFLLSKHKKRHINQRDYKCSLCGKDFFEKGTLREHMLIHNSERKFECNLCDAIFLLQKSLIRHKRRHENIKTLKCKLCNAVFVQKRGLNTHMKRKHKDEQQVG